MLLLHFNLDRLELLLRLQVRVKGGVHLLVGVHHLGILLRTGFVVGLLEHVLEELLAVAELHRERQIGNEVLVLHEVHIEAQVEHVFALLLD